MNPSNLFVLNILTLPAFRGLPKEKQDNLLKDAAQQILEQVTEEIVKALPENKQKGFLSLFTQPSAEEKKSSFFKTQVLPHINIPQTLITEIINFKAGLGGVKN